MKRIRLLALGVAAAAILGCLVSSTTARSAETKATEKGYAGAEACKECHVDAFEKFATTSPRVCSEVSNNVSNCSS